MRLQPRAVRDLLTSSHLERLLAAIVPTVLPANDVVHVGACRHAVDDRARPVTTTGTITVAAYLALPAERRSCWRCGQHDVVLDLLDPSGTLTAITTAKRARAHLDRLLANGDTAASNLAKAQRAYTAAVETLARLDELDGPADDDVRAARRSALDDHARSQARPAVGRQPDTAAVRLRHELAGQDDLSGDDDTLVLVAWVACAPRAKLDAAAAAWGLTRTGSRVVAAVPLWGLGWLIRQVATLSQRRNKAPIDIAAHPGVAAAAIAARLYDPTSNGPLHTLAGAVAAALLVTDH